MIILPEYISMAVYIMIAIYYTHIQPIFGLLSAIILIFYDNISKKTEGFVSSNKIPKIIYQTWHSKELPSKMTECIDRLKRANPEFEYRFYTDDDCRSFIKDNFDTDVLDAYNSLLPGAFKADLWRYCVLYKTGGVYLDIKFQCEPGFSLDNIIKDNFYVREYNHLGTGLYNHIIYTGCISSRPENPLFMKCIKQIVENCNTQYYGPEHTAPTGPYLFASMMDPFLIENCEYAYYEENGIGYIRNIDDKHIILSHYPEYRKEQKSFGKGIYWKDAWMNREIYNPKIDLFI
jgi:mannosyltransferase OCH1-like enzyme